MTHQYRNILIADPGLPPDLIAGLTKIGGLNPYGEPMLIFEWGGTALKWPGGPLKYWSRIDENYARHGVEGWFVSKWWPPERCMVEGIKWWNNNRYSSAKDFLEHGVPPGIDLLGPPPVRGQYRCELEVVDPDTKKPIKPDQRVLDLYQYWVWQHNQEPDLSTMDVEQQAAYFAKQNREDAERAEKIREDWHGMYREMVRNELEPMAPRLGRTAERMRAGMDSQFRRGETYDPEAGQKQIILTDAD